MDKHCAVCGSGLAKAFETTILKKYPGAYFFCRSCGLIQVAEPFWLDEAYSEAIVLADTGLVYRNILTASKLSAYLFLTGLGDRNCVDLAGGTGLLVRLMRDNGFNYFWQDPYSTNIHARGFEYKESTGPVELATALEVLEHVLDPVGFIRNAFSKYGIQSLVISTELFEGMPPAPQSWDYYSPETGQHISFFQRRTLVFIANMLNLNFASFGGLHIFSRKKIGRVRLMLSFCRFPFPPGIVIRRFYKSKMISDYHELLGR